MSVLEHKIDFAVLVTPEFLIQYVMRRGRGNSNQLCLHYGRNHQ